MEKDKDKSSSFPTLPRQLKMVAWYNPLQLGMTAVDVLISVIFGRHSDYRLIEALDTPNITIKDYSHVETENEFWIDYTADLGDGWNSTYTIAYHIAQPHLLLQDEDGNTHETKRGAILILGGDEVYPVASRKRYNERLINPYMMANYETEPPHPHMYAIPGNHDWYDSLASFTRLFCSKRWFAGWRTQQERSYFALKLPYHWWLIGTDIQLDSDIDDTQVTFFKTVAEQMGDQDKVILCTAEPEWIYTKMYENVDPQYSENNLAFLENIIFKDKISIFLTGDLHHYTRHEDPNGRQKIIAGGGGAFLHPTHGHDVATLSDGFILKQNFPDEGTSKKLCNRNFFFLFLNPYFGFVTALFYLLTVWSAKVNLGGVGISDWKQALILVINQVLKSPVGMFWIVAAIAGFIVFTNTHSTLYRYTAGFLHGLVHLFAAFLLGWGAIFLCNYFGFIYDSIPQLLLSGLIVFVGGWVIGSFVMGIYLLISLNIFGHHSNESFSSLAIQDWKNFLKIKIDATGCVTIYPIGFRRVSRKWKPREENISGSYLIPNDPKATGAELIEKPIKVLRDTNKN